MKNTCVTFTFYETYVTVNDISHSVYRIVEDLPSVEKDGYKLVRSKCLDEQNRTCILCIMSYTDCRNSKIELYYPAFSFKYIIDNAL